MESGSETTYTFYPTSDGIVTISCPKCNVCRWVEAKSIKRASEGFRIRCKCGEIFKGRVEFREHYRKQAKLAGIYEHLGTGWKGKITVEDLSLGGIGLRTFVEHEFEIGDMLEINFNLDDKKNSAVTLKVEVRTIQDRFVGTQIRDEEWRKKDLGFYLMK
jgi:PilZ domain